MNATQEQLFEIIEKRVKKLMKVEMPVAETEVSPDRHVSAISKHTFLERSRQEEFEGIMLTFVNNQEGQIRQLEVQMENTQNTFMDFG